jgi:hypothetical protein
MSMNCCHIDTLFSRGASYRLAFLAAARYKYGVNLPQRGMKGQGDRS